MELDVELKRQNETMQHIHSLINKIGSYLFSDYINIYGREIGLPHLKFDNNGICSLTFDGKINILIAYNKEKNQCLLTSQIGPIPSNNLKEFLKTILISNAFGIENGGALLGIEKDTNSLVLSYVFIPSTFSYSLFKTVLLNFVTMVENWQSKYENLVGNSNGKKIKFKNFYIKKNKFQFNFDFSKIYAVKEDIEFSEYIPKYGKEIGLPNLKLNDNNVCSLNYDGKINVDIVYNKKNNQCFFASPIGNIPTNPNENYYKKLLISNAFGTETGGAMLGIEEEGNRIVLAYNFISNIISFELFKTLLRNFVNLVEEWQVKHKSLCEVKSYPWQFDLFKYLSY